jgi:hypothetical protein
VDVCRFSRKMVSKFVSLRALPLTFGLGRWLQSAKFHSSPHRRALSVHSSRTFQLKCYPAAIPHPEKAAKGGEDAHFVLEVEPGGTRQHSAVGVADGVGGWAAQGVDAGLYSSSLMKWTRHRLQQAQYNKFYYYALCILHFHSIYYKILLLFHIQVCR